MTPPPSNELPGLTPTALPPPQTGRYSVERDRPNNPLKRSALQAPPQGYPHEDEKTVTMGTVSGEEAPMEDEVGSHLRVGRRVKSIQN
jgi:hypothetical protein